MLATLPGQFAQYVAQFHPFISFSWNCASIGVLCFDLLSPDIIQPVAMCHGYGRPPTIQSPPSPPLLTPDSWWPAIKSGEPRHMSDVSCKRRCVPGVLQEP
eukprot:63907-Chlamydomonas_euryale.AAC.1